MEWLLSKSGLRRCNSAAAVWRQRTLHYHWLYNGAIFTSCCTSKDGKFVTTAPSGNYHISLITEPTTTLPMVSYHTRKRNHMMRTAAFWWSLLWGLYANSHSSKVALSGSPWSPFYTLETLWKAFVTRHHCQTTLPCREAQEHCQKRRRFPMMRQQPSLEPTNLRQSQGNWHINVLFSQINGFEGL